MLPSWFLKLPAITFLGIHLHLLITTLLWIWPQRHLNLGLQQWNRLLGRLSFEWKLETLWKGRLRPVLITFFVKLVVRVVFLSFSAFVWRGLREQDSGLGLHFEDECMHQIVFLPSPSGQGSTLSYVVDQGRGQLLSPPLTPIGGPWERPIRIHQYLIPSETEARIYCLGADTVFPKVQP